MNKILYLFTILTLISACSFHDSGGFWSKEKKLKKNQIKFKPVFEVEEIILQFTLTTFLPPTLVKT